MTEQEMIARKLRQVYDVLHCIYDQHEDEGDRCYFGSTNDPHTMKRQLRRMESILATLEASRTPEGMVMVPREPTEAMLDALARQAQKPTGWHDVYPAMYRALLAAASPTPEGAA